MSLKKIVLMFLMFASAISAVYVRPTHKIADDRKGFVLEKVIPTSFGDWQMLPEDHNGIVNPEQTEIINKIYSQTLSRTYVNNQGEKVMLAIAYGEDQSDGTQLHYPEVCYPAQGFQVSPTQKGQISLIPGQLKVKRLVAVMGSRYEPIIYWTTIGNKVVWSKTETKIIKIQYGLKGDIADGLLFRVSTITNQSDLAQVYLLQEDFIRNLLAALPAKHKSVFIGTSL